MFASVDTPNSYCGPASWPQSMLKSCLLVYVCTHYLRLYGSSGFLCNRKLLEPQCWLHALLQNVCIVFVEQHQQRKQNVFVCTRRLASDLSDLNTNRHTHAHTATGSCSSRSSSTRSTVKCLRLLTNVCHRCSYIVSSHLVSSYTCEQLV